MYACLFVFLSVHQETLVGYKLNLQFNACAKIFGGNLFSVY
jgi:hypothetical protein